MGKIGNYFWFFVLLLILAGSSLCAADTADEWIDKGDEYYAQGLFDKAIDAYDLALTIDP